MHLLRSERKRECLTFLHGVGAARAIDKGSAHPPAARKPSSQPGSHPSPRPHCAGSASVSRCMRQTSAAKRGRSALSGYSRLQGADRRFLMSHNSDATGRVHTSHGAVERGNIGSCLHFASMPHARGHSLEMVLDTECRSEITDCCKNMTGDRQGDRQIIV